MSSHNIDNISISKKTYFDYLKIVRVNNSFYLRPATYEEICDIIQDVNTLITAEEYICPISMLQKYGGRIYSFFYYKYCVQFFAVF